MSNSSTRFAKLINISTVTFLLLSSGLQASPALARPLKVDPFQVNNLALQQKERVTKCLNSLQGTISSTPQPVDLWQTATLSWNATVPSTSVFCTGIDVKLYVDGQVVSPVGSRSIQPIADYKSFLIATSGGGTQRTLATAIT